MEIAQEIEIKEENIRKLRIKDVSEISGLELVKHIESKAKSGS
jgi:hypothetical protein